LPTTIARASLCPAVGPSGLALWREPPSMGLGASVRAQNPQIGANSKTKLWLGRQLRCYFKTDALPS
jgi:hypothetical protein